jgi:hypothetical protein
VAVGPGTGVVAVPPGAEVVAVAPGAEVVAVAPEVVAVEPCTGVVVLAPVPALPAPVRCELLVECPPDPHAPSTSAVATTARAREPTARTAQIIAPASSLDRRTG